MNLKTLAAELRGRVEQTEPLKTPTLNFPGYFDANVVPQGLVGLSLPLVNVQMGITPNLTFSANVPLLFYMAEQWEPAFLGMARYRFFSNQRLSSALSAYGGYFSYKDSADSLNLYFINATYNNAITLTKSQVLITQIGGLKAQYKRQSQDSLNFDEKSVNALTFALGHNYIFSPRWSIENVFAFPISMSFTTQDINSVGTVEFKNLKSFPIFFRSFVSWKSSQDSLLTGGFFFLTQTDINFIILPWINWTIIF